MPDLNDARRAGVKVPFHGEPILTPRSGDTHSAAKNADENGSPVARIVCIDDVEPEEVCWLWPGWFPLGKLSILDGDPGLGKSTAMLDIAARVSSGALMPDGTPGAEGSVIVISAEDGVADTIKPRLGAALADQMKCHALAGFDEPGGTVRPFELPDDVVLLSQIVVDKGVVLVIIDPLVAFLGGGANAHRDADVRRALAPLAKMAEEVGAAVVGIRHLNKMAGGQAIYRGGGSIAFTGAARAVSMVGRDPDDSECRVLASVKSNLARAPKSLRFKLVSAGAVARIEWLGPCDLTADRLCSPRRSGGSALDDAEVFLTEALLNGPRPQKEIKAGAAKAGVSWTSVERAKTKLKVTSKKDGLEKDDFKKGSPWRWHLPVALEDAESFEGDQQSLLSTFEGEGPAETPESSMILRRCSTSFEGDQHEGDQPPLITFEGTPFEDAPNAADPGNEEVL